MELRTASNGRDDRLPSYEMLYAVHRYRLYKTCESIDLSTFKLGGSSKSGCGLKL